MNELKPEDVMKALECCTTDAITLGVPCRNCPYNECNIVGGQSKRQTSGTCRSWLMKDALALLREKDAQYKELWEERMRIYRDLQEWKAECKKYQDAWGEKDAEIERLKGALKAEERHNELTMECAKKALANARSEAITEFAERLKKAIYSTSWDGDMFAIIRKIAKEMKGEQG